MSQKILFVRHGATRGNFAHRYIGTTDEALCAEGREQLKRLHYPSTKTVYVSPLLRCKQSAKLLFPFAQQIEVEDLREMDFGSFEGRSYCDMEDDSAYVAWLASNCEAPCPNGEAKAEFIDRCCAAFARIMAVDSASQITFVVHGGTIMAILSRYGRPVFDYFDWMVPCGKGYLLEWDTKTQTLQLLQEY